MNVGIEIMFVILHVIMVKLIALFKLFKIICDGKK